MVVTFNVPIQVEITDSDVHKYAEQQECVIKRIDETINSVTDQLADGIAADFFKEHIDIETVEINGEGFYY